MLGVCEAAPSPDLVDADGGPLLRTAERLHAQLLHAGQGEDRLGPVHHHHGDHGACAGARHHRDARGRASLRGVAQADRLLSPGAAGESPHGPQGDARQSAGDERGLRGPPRIDALEVPKRRAPPVCLERRVGELAAAERLPRQEQVHRSHATFPRRLYGQWVQALGRNSGGGHHGDHAHELGRRRDGQQLPRRRPPPAPRSVVGLRAAAGLGRSCGG
mmetsp:Transcript_9968/g.37625  ORF Transcript_9968/g.37625 Transcript_9968/m.37625 type:complete len:218 (-) Transcript_9968:431-1084(-)